MIKLRERKQRPSKPLAVMLPDIDWLAKCSATGEDKMLREMLSSPVAPIVLTAKNNRSPLCAAVAPYLDEVGLMLPFTPLHHLLMRAVQLPLVMTSGNAGGCAPVLTNEQALTQLAGIADV